MKKYLLFYISALACLTETALAQPLTKDTPDRKQVPWSFPDKMIKPASGFITAAHIPEPKKPFVASLIYTREAVTKARAKCTGLKIPNATIVLNADRINNYTANLQWETNYAFKASGFNIERSLADTFHFIVVNFASASKRNGIKKNYQLPDHNDYRNISFYRIKQLNSDAAYTYSNIVSVKGYDDVPFRIYPSPATQRIWIKIPAKLNGNATLMLYDATGKMIRHQALNCTKDVLNIQTVDVSKFAAGIYQLKILMPDKTFLIGKFIKE